MDGTMTDELERCKAWIGRSASTVDELALHPARAAAAMLDADGLQFESGAALPPLWHWFYFLATEPQSRLGEDGHPERGGFMPPVPLPRRMFAGSRMHFHQPLQLGVPATREGTIRNVAIKTGGSGALVFVTVGYQFRQDGKLCIDEEQDIVYKEAGPAVPAPEIVDPAPAAPGSWCRTIEADSRLLFRFSALTFNAHRIHYDRPYASEEEGYPGLVVHGPLVAVLLADLVRRNTPQLIEAFSFRGKAPLFDLTPCRLKGRLEENKVELEAYGPEGRVTMAATAKLA